MNKHRPSVQLQFDALEESDAKEHLPHQEHTTGARLVDDISFTQVESLPAFDTIEHGDLFALSLSNETTSLTHGLHRFPAKYIPQIPRWALAQFATPTAHVVDPFMGSGTTLVEGLRFGGTSYGIDIDPLARLIARAKTDVLSTTRIISLLDVLRERWTEPAHELICPMPDIPNFDHWFTHAAWGWLQSLLATIMSLDCSESERRFLLVVFSSILRWVSNADDQSQKTYVSGTLPKTPPTVVDTFWHHMRRAIRGLRQLETTRIPTAQVHIREDGDATDLQFSPASVDLIVTSPPYLDSVDYMYNLMLEYFWLGPHLGVPDRKTFNALRRLPLGAKTPPQAGVIGHEVCADLIDTEHMPTARLRATAAYLEGMLMHFKVASSALHTNSRYVLVVGNSQTSNNIVPVHDCLIRLAAIANLELEKAFAYRVRRHYMKFPRKGRGGIILLDWVIVLRKVDRSVSTPRRLPLPWVTLADGAVAH